MTEGPPPPNWPPPPDWQFPPPPPPKGEREYSTIVFPYASFEDAFTVARAIFDKGGIPLDKQQLAGQMNAAGSFPQKLGSAKTFGLIEVVSGKYQLTQLAYAALDKNEVRQRAARAEAFLNVPLYKRLYDDFKGKMLPPRAGLEQTFVSYGVPQKMKGHAWIAFDKSASQTGYYVNGNQDRLIAPIVGSATSFSDTSLSETEILSPPLQIARPEVKHVTSFVPEAGHGAASNPFVQGLLEELPVARTPWPHDERVKWLQAAAQIFELIYKPGENDTASEYVNVCLMAK